MDHSIYIYGDEIDEILKKLYNLTDKDLANDDSAAAHPSYHPGSPTDVLGKIRVCAPQYNDGFHISITDYLDRISFDAFQTLWNDDAKKQIISRLLRYPGGQHEWFTISNLPQLKAMSVPLSIVTKYRTPTSSCVFYVNNKPFLHGQKHSTEMHNALYTCIQRAYAEFVNKKIFRLTQPILAKESLKLLAYELQNTFIPMYYSGTIGSMNVPQALTDFIFDVKSYTDA